MILVSMVLLGRWEGWQFGRAEVLEADDIEYGRYRIWTIMALGTLRPSYLSSLFGLGREGPFLLVSFGKYALSMVLGSAVVGVSSSDCELGFGLAYIH